MKMKRLFNQSFLLTIGFVLFLAFYGCHSRQEVHDVSSTVDYASQGDSITTLAQTALLQRVSQAMKEGGTGFAVEYCNLNAMPIMDSLSSHHRVRIERLSDKNRNPTNAIASQVDKNAWDSLSIGKTNILEQSGDNTVYYKPIKLGMATCLKCHGDKEEITPEVQKIIRTKYPNDLATGYHQGDLRGMWKVTFVN